MSSTEKEISPKVNQYISTLLELCAKQASWPALLQDAEELTVFAITTRYPEKMKK